MTPNVITKNEVSTGNTVTTFPHDHLVTPWIFDRLIRLWYGDITLSKTYYCLNPEEKAHEIYQVCMYLMCDEPVTDLESLITHRCNFSLERRDDGVIFRLYVGRCHTKLRHLRHRCGEWVVKSGELAPAALIDLLNEVIEIDTKSRRDPLCDVSMTIAYIKVVRVNVKDKITLQVNGLFLEIKALPGQEIRPIPFISRVFSGDISSAKQRLPLQSEPVSGTPGQQ